jgi:hypothetical protein
MSKSKQKREYTTNKTAFDAGIPCPHCKARYGHHVRNTYPNGNRRRTCGTCGMPFVTLRQQETC